MKNPWISNAILISIKKRHKLFKSHFLSKNPDKIIYYKSYNNKLNKIKEAAKTNYYRAQFERNKGNLKTTWKLIGTIVNRKVSHFPPDIKKLVIEQKSYIQI
jgi:hypothetical protein